MSILRDLKIPHMGSVENAKLLEWRVEEGASFAAGDILYEVETDKVATEVEADEPGTLVRQLASDGDEHKVGDRVGLWAASGTSASAIAEAIAAFDRAAETAGSASAPPSEPAPGASNQDVPVQAEDRAQLSPLVRKLAREHDVDLATLTGSGPGGRILGEDVLAAAAKRTAAPTDSEIRVVAHSLRRKTIAKRMTEAAAIPSLTADMQIDLTALLARRAADKAQGRQASIMAYIARAACALLADQHSGLNAHYTDDALLVSARVHLGIAVDTPDGLVVPVIRDAQALDAPALSNRIAELAARARDGELAAADLEGGTFTLSNPGSLGPVLRAEALLVVPQVALLGLPGIVRAPVAVERDGGWQIEARPVVRPSLTFDHRALDGGTVIAFLNDLKAALETL